MTLAKKIECLVSVVVFCLLIVAGFSYVAYVGVKTPDAKRGIESMVLGL